MVVVKKSVTDRLKTVKVKQQRTEPLWKGPEVDGITQSMLSRFLVCRERFRVAYIVGLKPADQFYAPLEFGNMWHVCEEAYARGEKPGLVTHDWTEVLMQYCQGLCKKYPLAQQQVNDWYEKCKALFPIYVEHWSQHQDVVDRTPLMQEQVFDVPYLLPSGRTVRLRGKWDSVDLIGKGRDAGVYLQENKTKSAIDTAKLTRQLGFDLQTMLYLTALAWTNHHDEEGNGLPAPKLLPGSPVKGVRYNVIRRSAHKSVESMLKKLSEDRDDGRIGEWFSRWKVEVSPQDITRFRRECLDPILEQLCDWYETVTKDNGVNDPFRSYYVNGTEYYVHWRHPFGVYNVLDEGGSSDLDTYLDTGSEVGLRRVETLFEELS